MVKIREIDLKAAVLRLQAPTRETHIGICLDASGSMGRIKDEIIGAFNATVDQLNADKAKLGDVYVTLVTFGEGRGEVAIKYRRQPLSELKKLSPETYLPSAMTPFYDGLGMLLTCLEADDRRDGVDRAFLVNVFTDGLENASREWTRFTLADKLRDVQGRGTWTITYAGANVNLDRVSQQIGIPRANMQGFEASGVGTQILTGQHTNSMASYSTARSAGMTQLGTFYSPGVYEPNEIGVAPNLRPEPPTMTLMEAQRQRLVDHLRGEPSTGIKLTVDADEDDDNSLS